MQDRIGCNQASRIGIEDDDAGFIPCTNIEDGRDAARGTQGTTCKRNTQSSEARGHGES